MKKEYLPLLALTHWQDNWSWDRGPRFIEAYSTSGISRLPTERCPMPTWQACRSVRVVAYCSQRVAHLHLAWEKAPIVPGGASSLYSTEKIEMRRHPSGCAI